MTNKMKCTLGLFSLLVAMTIPWFCPASAVAQPLGLFDDHVDIGNVRTPGTAFYDDGAQTYTISASGTNMWYDRDEFHFVWKRMTGDFILRAQAEFMGEGVDPHRKIGWIIRSSLDTSAAYVDIALHGDGLMALQFRRTRGAETEHIVAELEGPDVLQLTRKGHAYTMSVAHFGEPFQSDSIADIDLGDEVYVGLFVCAHNPDVVEEAVFHNVRIVVPAADDFRPYRDYLGSNLEIMDVETGHRLNLRTANEAMQAPNWTRDGNALIYNSDGLLFRFDLASREPHVIDTDFVARNNNDHVLSFDGATLGISDFSPTHGGSSIIYTVPLAGGVPKQVTPTGPSYLHGWSPDNRWLVFAGLRNENFDIYRISVDGGAELRLTTPEAVDDGPEYTPNGQYIYFNSARTGSMEIWRMRPDGGEKKQLTEDEFNNWFPHISPDGKEIVFISFQNDIAPGDHPWYRHVYLRRMPIDGGTPQIIAYLYGGQGTINVPSWSPDGTKIAFVSNTAIEP